MKKSYFLMAAAATMLAACSQSDVLNEVQVQEEAQAIGFSTYAGKATRAINATNLEDYHKTFGVWTYKTYEDNGTTVMPNYQVMHNDGGSRPGDWSYDGGNAPAGQSLKYWDKRASYQFYAYAPYSQSVTIDANKVITIPQGEYAANENMQTEFSTTLNGNDFTGVGNSRLTESTDWMIASVKSFGVGVNHLVEEQFSHTMSKLIVSLKKEDITEDVIINSVSVNNVYGTGAYNTTAGWGSLGAAKSVKGSIGTIVTGSPYFSMEYLLIPSIYAPTFSVNYTINGDTYDVKDAPITGITGFAPNTVYKLTVTISADPIEFDAKVSPWETGVTGSVIIQ